MKHSYLLVLLVAFWFASPAVPPVMPQQITASDMATPVTEDNLDPAAFAQWVDGSEKPILNDKRIPRSPETAIWTTAPHFLYPSLIYGDSKAPGKRYLRIGFKNRVLIGSVLVRGGGQLSVLEADAAYPGNLNDDSQWIPAQRLKSGRAITDEVDSAQDALWVLPSVTATRALRFTHVAQVSDPVYGGTFNGAYVLSKRLANLAPQAVATAKSSAQYAGRLNDEKDNGRSVWDNIPSREGDRPKTIAEDPEWLTLTWPLPITINGLASLGTGYSAADVQIYTGRADTHPSLATEDSWKTIRTVSGWKSLYPGILQVHFIDLGRTVTTRAIRLRITAPLNEKEVHPHLIGKTNNGKRVWLDQLMAFRPLYAAGLESAVLPVAADKNHPPIAIRFRLPEDGFVTLVIEDSSGRRIRNLIADTVFPKGENTVYWDGTDDLKRDQDAANHGLYNIPSEFVVPGAYRVRGIWHRQIDLNYELSVYSPGDPPWPTQDTSGGWMTNHTPASCVVFIPPEKAPNRQPLIGIGAYVSEGGSAFSWVNLGGKKIGGRGWIGGAWTGAQYLAGDSGPDRELKVAAYAGSVFEGNKKYGVDGRIEIRLTKLTTLVPGGDQPVLKDTILLDPLPPVRNAGAGGATNFPKTDYLGGLAVRNGLLVFSETALNKVVFIDAKAGKIVGEAAVPNPGALAFDGQGRLLLLSGQTLRRYSSVAAGTAPSLPDSEKLVVTGLEDPRGITLDAAGKIYISDQGNSHQVKVFSPDGLPRLTIGHPGAPKGGQYDPLHMNHPKGLAVDSNGRIWVTEESFQPKRVSVWNPDGTLWRAFYGPAGYGGGGALDAQDSRRFSYDGMEFHIDWDKGISTLRRIYYPTDSVGLKLAFRSAPPELSLHFNDKRYMTNAFNSSPTNGSNTAFLFLDKGDVVVPVAAAGSANEWDILKGDAFRPFWPTGVDPNGDRGKNQAMFIWSDRNGDGQVQPEEVKIWAAGNGGVTVGTDGSFLINNVHLDKEAGHAIRYKPIQFTQQGVPVYNPIGEVLADAQAVPSDGGGQILMGTKGWTVLTTAPPHFSNYGLGGAKDGVALWSYPSLWPGLHASHSSPPPDHQGELIGTTRLLGDFVTPRDSDAGPLFFINGNQGDIYVFTQDGLFVTQLFRDVRQGAPWEMPAAPRGMLLNNVTLHDENFFPTVTQIPDGSIYLDSGFLSALVKVDGLESIRRLPPTSVSVSADDLKLTQDFVAQREAARQATQGTGVLDVVLQTQATALDANPDSWVGAAWAPIDRRGVAAYIDSHSKPYDVQAALTIAGGRLFALWKTGDPQLLKNSGGIDNALFKTGGALDLMISTDPKADPKRMRPVAGDLRFLVTQVNGKTKAVLYREVVPGTPDKQRVPFSAPWHSVTFDSVTDVSNQVQLAVDGTGDYEVAVPLDLLGLNPQDGLRIKGDIGILRGDGAQTTQRVYWNNKATAIVSDVPSEAMLTPGLWGIWEFRSR
jgi:NHL repeat